MREPPKSVVVTGASSGIGRACALRLARSGTQVFAGLRSDEDAAAWRHVRGVSPLRLELRDTDSITRAGNEVGARLAGRPLHGLVHAAGVAVVSPLEFLPIATLQEQLMINLSGPLALTQGLLPLLRREKGRIVFLSSMSARVASPFLGAYAASKFALEALVDTLRVELQPWQIQVCSIQPGPVASPLWQKSLARAESLLSAAGPRAEKLYGSRLARLRTRAQRVAAGRGIPPDLVARCVHRALDQRRPRTRYLVGRHTRVIATALYLAPDRLRDLWLRVALAGRSAHLRG